MGWDAAEGGEGIAKGDEVAAAGALARKAARARACVVLPLLTAGVLLGLLATLIVTGFGGDEGGLPISKAVVCVTFVVPAVGCGLLARAVGKWVVRQRGPSWAEEIARRYCVSKAALTDLTRYWD